MPRNVLIFGYGYVAKFLANMLSEQGDTVYCTSRKCSLNPLSTLNKNISQNPRVQLIHFLDARLPDVISMADAIISTIPPNSYSLPVTMREQFDNFIDPVLSLYEKNIAQLHSSAWLCYLSSTGVYGDHQGCWINEESPCRATDIRAKARLSAEEQWLNFYKQRGMASHILRLSGIYGPEQNCLEEILNGKDFTVVKPGHCFSRIHVTDICQAILALMNKPMPGQIYNISDEEPAPLHIVQQFGAKLLGKNKLREIPIETAVLSEHARIFFAANKKISGYKIVHDVSIRWQYPNYRVGLMYGCLPYLRGEPFRG